MSQVINITLNFDQSLEQHLEQNYPEVVDFRILSKSMDARGSNRGRTPVVIYKIETIENEEKFTDLDMILPEVGAFKQRPIIVGAGPAGLFCALALADSGVPCILLERGPRASERMKKIAKFWRYGILDPEANVCYGEGGAGLFSDGKLITRIKDKHVQYVMNKLVEFGAPKEVAYESNPHLGSNKIRSLITSLSNYLITRGVEMRFNTQVKKIHYIQSDSTQEKIITGVEISGGEILASNNVVLATGHSAKDIYSNLAAIKVAMKPKDFAIGVRIEHPRRLIDFLQFGGFCQNPKMQAARYRLSFENKQTRRGTYSFCMCPGGHVLSSGTEADGLVVNGMSNYARNSPWSNSALVVAVKAGVDFSSEQIMAGIDFQTQIEQKAYTYSKEHATGREIPAQTVHNFLHRDTLDSKLPKSSCPSGLVAANLSQILPPFVTDHLRAALLEFNQEVKGFAGREGLLLAPETRTSAALTVLRDKSTFESISHAGLYPCGEGAGHAGGITSSAVDGIRVARSLIAKEKGIS